MKADTDVGYGDDMYVNIPDLKSNVDISPVDASKYSQKYVIQICIIPRLK